MADFYPDGMEARASWHQNFFTQLVAALQTKYNINATQGTQIQNDNAWMQYWVQARITANALSQQLTQYFNGIAGNDPTLDPPAVIVFALPTPVPGEVPPGIEFRVREIARQIKGHSSYSQADGELLGIVSSGAAPEVEGNVTPALTVSAVIPYKFNVKGSMRGKDQIRIEYQRNGGDWTTVGFFTKLPVDVTIAPHTPGQPEAGQVRAQYVDDNEPFGNYSVNYPVVLS